MFEPGLLANQRILVSGGGSGLGFALARKLMRLGARLYSCGRRRPVIMLDGAHHQAHGSVYSPLLEVTPNQWTHTTAQIRAGAARDKALRSVGSAAA